MACLNDQRLAHVRRGFSQCVAPCFAASLVLLCPTIAVAAVPLYGGPTYNSATGTGFLSPVLPLFPGSTAGNGTGVGAAERAQGGTSLGYRALRWSASGSGPVELVGLGASPSGFTSSQAFAIGGDGTTVGFARKYASGVDRGDRAVRWNGFDNTVTELETLGTDGAGNSFSRAYAVNSTGTIVGSANKYVGGVGLGSRAVRWSASSTVATELSHLGTSAGGATSAQASAINATGTAVGFALKYNSGGLSLGYRAVRWDASGTAATELGNLGTPLSGITDVYATAINADGIAVGRAVKYSGGNNLGELAVRWAPSGVIATELGNLGVNSSGATSSVASAINNSGTIVGSAQKYQNNVYLGGRAVRWEASGIAATELGNLGTSPSGFSTGRAHAINAAGVAVGSVQRFSGGVDFGSRAVCWGLDGVAVDLNSLLTPADQALWVLWEARGISDSFWVTGIGTFDPDGPGGQAAYDRLFLMRLSTLAPQPCNRADVTNLGDTGAGADGQLSVDDVIAFFNVFSDSTGCPSQSAPIGPACSLADLTDLGDTGAGADGQLTVDDVIAFVNAFTDGCL